MFREVLTSPPTVNEGACKQCTISGTTFLCSPQSQSVSMLGHQHLLGKCKYDNLMGYQRQSGSVKIWPVGGTKGLLLEKNCLLKEH